MRGSGPWNPNAIRVSERILVSALDPGRVGLTEHRSCAGIESSPTSPTGSSVVPGRWTAATTACAGARSYRHDDRAVVVDVNAVDNGARQLADALSHSVVLHPVVRPVVAGRWTARNLEADRVQPPQRPPTHPQIEQK